MPLQKHLASFALLLAGGLSPLAARAQEASIKAGEIAFGASRGRLSIRFAIPFASIAAALAHNGLAISPDRLQLAVPVSATTSEPTLLLASAELRQDASLLLRMTCPNSGDCVPFFVTAAMSDRAEALAALAALHAHLAPPTVERASGISVGARIFLQLADEQMHIQIPAIAIDAGKPGSEIRVASLDRKHTYRGVVADAATVKAGLQ